MNNSTYDINSIGNIKLFHKVIHESIADEDDNYIPVKLKVIFNENTKNNHTIWMYYKNKYEFIIKCDLDNSGDWIVIKKQPKELMSSYLKRFCFKVITEKLKYNKNDNMCDNESWGKFIYNKAYLKKYNKSIVFKYIEGLQINNIVFKHIYSILCPVVSENQTLKFYKSPEEYEINIPQNDKCFDDVHNLQKKNKFIYYAAENNNKPVAVFRLNLFTEHTESQIEFYKSAILNHNKDFWLYALWYLEGEYDYVDASKFTEFGGFCKYEDYMAEFIQSYGDTFDKSKLIDMYENTTNDNDKINWMYYKNNKEFIITIKQKNKLKSNVMFEMESFDINCHCVEAIKLTGNEHNNIYGNISNNNFLLNTICIKKSNKNLIFKIIKDINVPLNIFKLYYPLLMIGNDECGVHYYKNGSALKNEIYDCICCTKSNTKFINFNSLNDNLSYFVVMNSNDPLAVLKLDTINEYDTYKSSYVSSSNSTNNICIICYTE